MLLIAALSLFLVSLLLTYFNRLFALKKNILDLPNQRSSHQVPVPRGGGLAFVILFYASLIYLTGNHIIQPNIFLSFLGGIPVAFVGYCDDMKSVKPKWRALIHICSAIWGLAWLHGVPSLDFGAMHLHSPILFFIFATFSTVWFINLYNFMDGIDGLAGIEAVFVSGAAGSFLLLNGFYDTAAICFVLAFLVLGFLAWNWPPAKIFMGDVGSGFLGYTFAMLMWTTNNYQQMPFPIWWILLAVFIADASYTLIHRIIQKKQLSVAHREHVYQRLTKSGLNHKQVTIGVLCINILICLPMMLLYFDFSGRLVFLFLATIVIVCWLAWFLFVRKYNAF